MLMIFDLFFSTKGSRSTGKVEVKIKAGKSFVAIHAKQI
jgi:hypothetical protein